MVSGRIHAVPLTTLLAIGPTGAVRIQTKTRPSACCGLRAVHSTLASGHAGPSPVVSSCRPSSRSTWLTEIRQAILAMITFDPPHVGAMELWIRRPESKSMLRTKRHCRKHLVAPCVPDRGLEKIGLNTHGLRISPGERLQKGIAAPLHFLILCDDSRARSWRGRRCARNFIRSSSRLRRWL